MTKAEFLEKFSKDILQLSSVLTEEAQLKDVEEWDSLAQISTIAFFDKELGITISFQDIQAAQSVQDLLKVFEHE